jgi:hypothetical protein
MRSNSLNQAYIGGSIFIWGTVTINLLGKSKRVWHPYLATCVTGALLEICILLVKDFLRTDRPYWSLDTTLQVCRIACLLVLISNILYHSVRRKLSQLRADEEHRPLLDPHGGIYEDYASAESEDEDYDALAAQDEDHVSDQTKELKERQRKRLQECGSWMAYLKDFKLLARLAWPSGDRSAKICLVILIVVILADRALNLLIPRQLGIITDKLSVVHETGQWIHAYSKIKANKTQARFLSKRSGCGCSTCGSVLMLGSTQSLNSVSSQSSSTLTERLEQQRSATS